MTTEPTLSPELSNLYESDFYAWTQEQAKLLHEGKWAHLDIPNLVEEIESLGRQERQELRNRLKVLLSHLLKWEFQPHHRSKSWFFTIREQRHEINIVLNVNPSLEPYLPEVLNIAYELGLDLAARETALNLKDFPSQCPYELENILDFAFLSGQPLTMEQQDWGR